MSTELLESIKRQIHSLTTAQKAELASFLNEQLRPGTDGGPEEQDSEAFRAMRMNWLKAHREQCGGQYVALHGDNLIAVGGSYRIARENAILAGRPDAFVTYLPKPDEVAEWGGWDA
jgi:hypothetical protein